MFSRTAHYVTRIFTDKGQLEPGGSGVIRVIPFYYPVPLVVMVIDQQETECLVHLPAAVVAVVVL